MLIELNFKCRNGIHHHVEGRWASTWDAIEWAQRVFGARAGSAKPM